MDLLTSPRPSRSRSTLKSNRSLALLENLLHKSKETKLKERWCSLYNEEAFTNCNEPDPDLQSAAILLKATFNLFKGLKTRVDDAERAEPPPCEKCALVEAECAEYKTKLNNMENALQNLVKFAGQDRSVSTSSDQQIMVNTLTQMLGTDFTSKCTDQTKDSNAKRKRSDETKASQETKKQKMKVVINEEKEETDGNIILVPETLPPTSPERKPRRNIIIPETLCTQYDLEQLSDHDETQANIISEAVTPVKPVPQSYQNTSPILGRSASAKKNDSRLNRHNFNQSQRETKSFTSLPMIKSPTSKLRLIPKVSPVKGVTLDKNRESLKNESLSSPSLLHGRVLKSNDDSCYQASKQVKRLDTDCGGKEKGKKKGLEGIEELQTHADARLHKRQDESVVSEKDTASRTAVDTSTGTKEKDVTTKNEKRDKERGSKDKGKSKLAAGTVKNEERLIEKDEDEAKKEASKRDSSIDKSKKGKTKKEAESKQELYWKLKPSTSRDLGTNVPLRGGQPKLKQTKLFTGVYPKKTDLTETKGFNGGLRPSQASLAEFGKCLRPSQMSTMTDFDATLKPAMINVDINLPGYDEEEATQLAMHRSLADISAVNDEDCLPPSPDVITQRSRKALSQRSRRRLIGSASQGVTTEAENMVPEDLLQEMAAPDAVFLRSYDRIPNRNSEEPKFAYQRDPVRKKAERMKLDGWDCDDCQKYFANADLTEEQRKERLNKCSKHRNKFERPRSPEGYWDIDFPTTQECKDRNLLVTQPSKPLRSTKSRTKL